MTGFLGFLFVEDVKAGDITGSDFSVEDVMKILISEEKMRFYHLTKFR